MSGKMIGFKLSVISAPSENDALIFFLMSKGFKDVKNHPSRINNVTAYYATTDYNISRILAKEIKEQFKNHWCQITIEPVYETTIGKITAFLRK